MPRFSMQTALDVRERIEKLKQKEFGEQLQVAQEIKSRIVESQEQIKQSHVYTNQLKNNGFTIAQLQFNQQFCQRMEQQIQVLEHQLQQQNEIVNRKQQSLLKATQDRRVLEILKEKEQQRYRKHQDRLDRLEMDEIAQNFSLQRRSR
ncbi:MAG: flagellar export protein FliJ [SAR324 cluster bacterium]|nr:flagellar export protein FliJ [SAR324 cluster bacterium]